ncbi:MAG: hypothetical protein ACRDTX_30140 [Pseudonocardiaceae bacterium]
MKSIRDYDGEIRVCIKCAQPAYQETFEEYGEMWHHFSEQWDGVLCESFPLAGYAVALDLTDMSRQSLQAQYPDTYPQSTPEASSGIRG